MNRLTISAVLAFASVAASAQNPFLNLDGGNFCLPKYPSHVMRTTGLRVEYIGTRWTAIGYRPQFAAKNDVSFLWSRAIVSSTPMSDDTFPNIVRLDSGSWVTIVAPVNGSPGYYWVF